MEFDDILRFFAAKGVRLKCPSCGQESQWELGYVPANDDPDIVIGVNSLMLALPDLPHNPMNPPMGPSMLLITSTCGNCSYVRSYNYMHIKAWLDENPERKARQGSGSEG